MTNGANGDLTDDRSPLLRGLWDKVITTREEAEPYREKCAAALLAWGNANEEYHRTLKARTSSGKDKA